MASTSARLMAWPNLTSVMAAASAAFGVREDLEEYTSASAAAGAGAVPARAAATASSTRRRAASSAAAMSASATPMARSSSSARLIGSLRPISSNLAGIAIFLRIALKMAAHPRGLAFDQRRGPPPARDRFDRRQRGSANGDDIVAVDPLGRNVESLGKFYRLRRELPRGRREFRPAVILANKQERQLPQSAPG